MVSRSSINSTSSLATNTSMILCDNRTIFSRLIPIPPSPADLNFFDKLQHLSARIGAPIFGASWLPQNEVAIAGQLRLHFLEHFLVGNAGAAHLVLVLGENLPGLFADAIFHGDFVHHGLAHALNDGGGVVDLDLFLFA